MKNFSIERRNCINGFWKVPDVDEGENMTIYEMARSYVGEDVTLRSISFYPANERDLGKQGVRGIVRIKYE